MSTSSATDDCGSGGGFGGNNTGRRMSTVSMRNNGLVPDDLSRKSGPTSGLTLDNDDEDNDDDDGDVDAVGTPSLTVYDDLGGMESIDDAFGNSANSEALSQVLSPLINDRESSYSIRGSVSGAPSIFSDDGTTSMLLGHTYSRLASVTSMKEMQMAQRPMANYGFQIEKADNESNTDLFFQRRKHYFILSAAGKPIYSMHGSDDIMTVYSGVIQTIVSFFQFGPDGQSERLRSVVAGTPDGRQVKLMFLNKSPIILMACSVLGESDVQLVQQLDFLFNFLVATLSKPHIEKVFQRRDNFDLRQLLGKTDIACLDAICDALANFNNPGIIVGGLECLRLRRTIRSRIEKLFLRHRSENVLYGLIVAPGGRLVSVMRPRRHTLHTSDLQLLFSMIYDTNTFKTSPATTGDADGATNGPARKLTLTQNEDFWVPVCLPKFNPNGFVYAFIQFMDMKDERLMKLHDINSTEGDLDADGAGTGTGTGPDNFVDTSLAVIMISAFKDSFFEMRKLSNAMIHDIKMSRSVYRELYKGIVGTQGADGSTGVPNGRISPEDVPAPLVKHFLYKSKRFTQYVYSRLQGTKETDIGLEDNPQMRGQLMMVYSYLHSKQSANVGLLDVKKGSVASKKESHNSSKDSLLSRRNYVDMIRWRVGNDYLTGALIATPNYELYLVNNGGVVNKKMLLGSCKSIIRWCRKNEERLFIKSGAVF